MSVESFEEFVRRVAPRDADVILAEYRRLPSEYVRELLNMGLPFNGQRPESAKIHRADEEALVSEIEQLEAENRRLKRKLAEIGWLAVWNGGSV